MVGLHGGSGRDTSDPGERKTWMDRFRELEPDGGFRTVYLMWQRKSPAARKSL